MEIDLRAKVRYADRQLRVLVEVERAGTTSLTITGTVAVWTGDALLVWVGDTGGGPRFWRYTPT